MFEFCLPTGGKAVPSGPDWYHEIKYDGFRLRVERNGDRVRLITRGVTIGLGGTRGSSKPR
jgi:bifunctional non-homologous end joining protein LigD